MALTHLNDATFADAIKSDLVVVDFWASWCGPCRMFGPTFETASDAHKNIKFAKFEIDDANKRTPAKYGIRSIPSILAFKDGEVVDTKMGMMSPQDFDDWLATLQG